MLALLSGNGLADWLPATKGFVGQPLLFLENDNIQACGIRFVGVNAPTNKQQTIWMADASFMVDRNSGGMVKAWLLKTSVNALNNGKQPVAETFKTFWIKTPKVRATKPVGEKPINDGDGAKIYMSDATSVIGLYRAVIEKKPIQLSYTFTDDTKDFTLYGKVSMSEEELSQASSCLNKLFIPINQTPDN